jgi:hypothetical protein
MTNATLAGRSADHEPEFFDGFAKCSGNADLKCPGAHCKPIKKLRLMISTTPGESGVKKHSATPRKTSAKPSAARVRTTHVSGTATDIGIELAMLYEVLRRKVSPKESEPDRQ